MGWKRMEVKLQGTLKKAHEVKRLTGIFSPVTLTAVGSKEKLTLENKTKYVASLCHVITEKNVNFEIFYMGSSILHAAHANHSQ